MKIPETRAIILWRDDAKMGGAVSDIHVCDISEQPSRVAELENSAGACSGAWLKGEWHETPMGIFLSLAVNGFQSRADRAQALREFAKIEGQKWAIDLLSALGEMYVASTNRIYAE